MKKLICFLLLIPFYGISQEVVKKSDLYQVPEKAILSQFVITHTGIDAQTAYASLRKWTSTKFANDKDADITKEDGLITCVSKINFLYSGFLNSSKEGKFTLQTKFECKDGRTRVTITELPSAYVSRTGSDSHIVWPNYTANKKWPTEYKNKFGSKTNYRRFTSALVEKDLWVSAIKAIDFSMPSGSLDDDDW